MHPQNIPSYCLILLAVISCLVPSTGLHNLLNPKTPALALASLTFPLALLYKPWTKPTLYTLLGTCLTLIPWILSLTKGMLHHNPYTLDASKLFFTTLLPLYIATTLTTQHLLRFETLVKALLIANMVYNGAKVLLVSVTMLGWMSLTTLMTLVPVRIMSMTMVDSMFRFQTSCDLYTPFLLFFCLLRQPFALNIGTKFSILFQILALLGTLLSFSRAFFGALVLAYSLAFLVAPWTRKIWHLFCFLCLSILMLLCVGPTTVSTLFHNRFTSQEVSVSDDIRTQQSHHLITHALENPITGSGMGSYATSCIRDAQNPYLYEVQWLALWSQIGLLGLVPFGIPFASNLYGLITSPNRLISFCLTLELLFFAILGFTNPFVISLSSGFLYTLFLLGGLLVQKNALYRTPTVS